MEKKVIGIIGGMGPLATSDLFKKIILNTDAKSDQEHIRVLIDNNTEIPDRTDSILHGGKSPLPELIKSAALLWAMGAEILVMPCNTAHYYHAELQKNIGIPILNMIDLTRAAILKSGAKRVGLLATEGTLRSGIYQSAFSGSGIEIITPTESEGRVIGDLIYKGVKAGDRDYDVSSARGVMDAMLLRGAEIFILGCTELPPAMEIYGLNYRVCDPTMELALGAIAAASGKTL